MNRYYRNIADLTSIEGIAVDEGSLWKLDTAQNLLILEDEDQYATTYLTDNFENI
ncbi:MAG TPA: hypothetical protein PKH16_10045 [Aequorivita sp.]|nr:hypothetical protein [Aequorivita sp.]